MPIINKFIELETEAGINIHNLTPQIEAIIEFKLVENRSINSEQ